MRGSLSVPVCVVSASGKWVPQKFVCGYEHRKWPFAATRLFRTSFEKAYLQVSKSKCIDFLLCSTSSAMCLWMSEPLAFYNMAAADALLSQATNHRHCSISIGEKDARGSLSCSLFPFPILIFRYVLKRAVAEYWCLLLVSCTSNYFRSFFSFLFLFNMLDVYEVHRDTNYS